MNSTPSRRDFLGISGTAVGGAWMAYHAPFIQAAAAYAWRAFQLRAPFQVLTPVEAEELEAMAAGIFPTDETPGAREAGVIHFIDRALATFAAGQITFIRAGLEQLAVKVAEAFPNSTRLSQLTASEQATTLKAIEQTPFFGLVRFLTVAGMFANPEHGGNRDGAGWKLLGFEMRPAYQPPFGHYDGIAGEEPTPR